MSGSLKFESFMRLLSNRQVLIIRAKALYTDNEIAYCILNVL